MTADWIADGHILVVEADGPHPEDGDVTYHVECPGEGCRAPFVACPECEGSGTIYPDDAERECPDCRGTGWDGGVRACWLATHADVADGLYEGEGDYVYEVGRWQIEHSSDGHYEDCFTDIRRLNVKTTSEQH